MQELILRRSPLVLIRTLILIEALAFIAYFLSLGGGGAKYELYNKLPLAMLLSYDAAKILFLSGMQLCITIYAFLRWYYERYRVVPGVAIHEYGVFLKKKRAVNFKVAPRSVVRPSFFGKFLHYGTIVLSGAGSGDVFVIPTISHPDHQKTLLMRTINPAVTLIDGEVRIHELLAHEEHEQLEFKSSLRFDHKLKRANSALERAAIKSVCAFLNSNGGNLVIGVGDDRSVLGLHQDFGTLPRNNADGFENHFTQIFNAMIGPEFRRFVRLTFHEVKGETICLVGVVPADRPAYVALDASEHFYIRTGNTTTALKLREIESYVPSHWPERGNALI